MHFCATQYLSEKNKFLLHGTRSLAPRWLATVEGIERTRLRGKGARKPLILRGNAPEEPKTSALLALASLLIAGDS